MSPASAQQQRPHAPPAPDRRAALLAVALKIAFVIVAVWSVALWWKAVDWAFRPHMFFIADEINNLDWALKVPYWRILHLWPERIYNDRPLGFALERFLFEQFGFDYARNAAWFLVLHFSNCLMGLWVFRKMGVRWMPALAWIGVWASLSTTAITATFLGAVFDVLCTFFLLASLLAFMGARRWHWYLSAVLYLLALRSKEFGIVIPVLLTLYLAARRPPGGTWREFAAECVRRLWPQYLILIVFGLRYVALAPQMAVLMPAGSDYHVAFSPGGFVKALVYYTGLVFGVESTMPARAVTLALVGIGLAALRRRNGKALVCLAAYGLTLLPVLLLPNIRSPYYLYGPQMFLLLAVCLTVEDIRLSIPSAPWSRAVAGVFIALLLLGGVTAFRRSHYFRDRVHFYWMAREASQRSANDLQALRLPLRPGAHLYIDSGAEIPWLFNEGPCRYLQILRRDESLECVIRKPADEMRKLYQLDAAPEKYWLDYSPNGALQLRDLR